jgi:anti-anti-sigma factor
MEYSLELRNAYAAVLRLEGSVTVYKLQDLKDLLGQVKGKIGARKRLILDLSSLTYFDPLALGVLVAFSREFRAAGGDIRIVSSGEDLIRTFEESRLSRVYAPYASVQEAERSFS